MPLEYQVHDRGGPQDRLLVFVHGYGEPPAMFTDRLELIDPHHRYLVVTPDAPHEKKGKPIWHRALFGESDEAQRQFRESLDRLQALITRLCDEHELDPARTVVAGFSQGAGLAVALTVTSSTLPPVAACLAFCGFVPPVAGLRLDRDRARGVGLFLPAATNDEFIELTSSRQSAELLASWGVLVTYHEASSGHAITDGTAALAGAWLDALEDGPPAPTPIPVAGTGHLGALIEELWAW